MGEGGRTRVLVVEDHDAIRLFLTMVLRNAGFAVTEATDGDEALEVVRRERPSAIVLDLTMPWLSGDEFARRLRAQPGGADIPVVVVSAASDALARGASIGAAAVLPKPVTPEALVAAVQRALPAG